MKFPLLALILFTCFSIYSQEVPPDTLSREKFLTMVTLNQDESYITFTEGIARHLSPLLFEAQLSPYYFVKKKNRRWALSFNPKVQMRMLRSESFPVQSPSYKLLINFYRGIDFWSKSFLQKIFYDDAFIYAGIGHHSNGQAGNFYLDMENKIVNIENGNFSTNFLRIGLSSYTVNKFNNYNSSIRELKTYIEIHPTPWVAEELDNTYGFYRLFASYGINGPSKIKKDNRLNNFLQKSSITFTGGWIFGNTREAALEVEERLIVDVRYKYHPAFLDEVAFFARFYRGQDYYNIHFINNLTQISIGITTSIISKKEATENLE